MTPNGILQSVKEQVLITLNDLKNARSYTYDFDYKSVEFKNAKKEAKSVLLSIASTALDLFQSTMKQHEITRNVSVRIFSADLCGFLEDAHLDDPHILVRDNRETPRAIKSQILISHVDQNTKDRVEYIVEVVRRFDDADGQYTWTIYRRGVFDTRLRSPKVTHATGEGESVLETLKHTLQSQIN
ncbi:hypothetical protein [Microcystis phage Mel-JY01]